MTKKSPKSREELKQELQKLLKWKKSRAFYASKLNCTLDEVSELLRSFSESSEPGLKKVYKVPPTPEELIKEYNVDTTKYTLGPIYVKQRQDGYTVSTSIKPKPVDRGYSSEFSEFLRTYQPKFPAKVSATINKSATGCLILNKQDAHLNKADFLEDSKVTDRSIALRKAINTILTKSLRLSFLDTIIYTIGSDEYNSEWTGSTTRGTPQQNTGSYYQDFQEICDFEVAVISTLQKYCNTLKVVYIPGNHDEFVGWHMAKWLETYFRETDIQFDTAPTYTKYFTFSNTALCFNHGYSVKPEQLADTFPIHFKSNWSSCDHFYIFLGDKHTELTKTIGGIEVYRLGQASNAKSKWDLQNDYSLNQGVVTGFLIEGASGITTILKEKL